MKKTILTVSIFASLFCSVKSFAQPWLANGGHIYVTPAANAGIGTSDPLAKLHVKGSALFTTATGAPTSGAYIRATNAYSTATTPEYTWWNNDQVGMFHPAAGEIGFTTNGGERIRINGIGYVGIGTSNPLVKLDVNGNVALNNNALYVRAGSDPWHGIAYRADVDGISVWGHSGGWLGTKDPSAGERVAISWNSAGNVGIGTLSVGSTFKLAVEGKLGAREIVVTTAPWADFVFDKNYKLMPLQEVEKFIQTNNHLPEIPSAKEIETSGANVGDVMKLHMQKIEELTLYLIEQQKSLAAQQKEIEALKAQLK